jgi:DNA polymerase III delta prime subunit
MAIKDLWVEKYRPKTIDEYVFKDEQQKAQIMEWITQQSIPNCIFSGVQGTGKSCLAQILINELQINNLDVLAINASRTNSVDDVRNKIVNFAQLIPFGDFNVIFLDECDFLSTAAQAALRGVMEAHHATTRFIFTANYPNRVIPAIHSRCQGFHIEKLDLNEFTARTAQILISEDIEFDLDTLDTFVKGTYPDLRKCINNVQLNSVNKKLMVPESSDNTTADYKIKMVELFKAGKITEARKLICGTARPEEMQDIYVWLYNNISLFGDEEKQNKATLIIKQALVDHVICADSEINMAACLIKLSYLN